MILLLDSSYIIILLDSTSMMNSSCRPNHFASYFLTISSAPSSLLPRSPGLGPGGYFTVGEEVARHEVHAGFNHVSVSSWWKVSSACFSPSPECRCVAGLLGTPVMCRTRRLVVSLVRLVLRTLLLLSSFWTDFAPS